MKSSDLFIGMEVTRAKLKDSISCFITEIKDECVVVDIIDTCGTNKLIPQTMIQIEDLINNWRRK